MIQGVRITRLTVGLKGNKVLAIWINAQYHIAQKVLLEE